MVNHKHPDLFHISKSLSLFQHFNIYNQQSFIRTYVLDSSCVCLLAYIIFYAVLWYANKIMKRVEKTNQEMQMIIEKNRSKLDNVAALKNKRSEFEDVVVKVKEAQSTIKQQLDVEMKKVNDELILAVSKMSNLEKIVNKWKLWKKSLNTSTSVLTSEEDTRPENVDLPKQNDWEFVKVLEPSFDPPLPIEPPPRKYGTFARRPPGRRPVPISKPQVSTTLTSQPIEF